MGRVQLCKGCGKSRRLGERRLLETQRKRSEKIATKERDAWHYVACDVLDGS